MMKKLLFAVVFISGWSFGQETVKDSKGNLIKLNSDKTWEYVPNSEPGKLQMSDFTPLSTKISAGVLPKKKIAVLNGVNEPTETEFLFLSDPDKFANITIEKINRMIDLSRAALIVKSRNWPSFSPKAVTVAWSDSTNSWMIGWTYTILNTDAEPTEQYKIYYFTDESEELFERE